MMIPKIAIVGPESSGKTSLAQDLAHSFQCPWVEEQARNYLEKLGRSYVEDDLLKIAREQLAAEEFHVQKSPKLLICDTNLLVIKIWSEYKYGHCSPALLDLMNLETYTLHFLCSPDIPWEYDPMREHPHQRKELFSFYETALQEAQLPYFVLTGNRLQRRDHAINQIASSVFGNH